MSETNASSDAQNQFRINDYPILRMAHVVSRVQERIVAGVTSYALMAPSWRVLALLADRGPMTVKALAEAALIDRSSLSRTIMRMEDDGLLRREDNPDDGRSSFLQLSPAGRALFDESQPVALAAMQLAGAQLSAEDKLALNAILDRMISSLESQTIRPKRK